MSATKIDGNFQVVSATGQPRITFPFYALGDDKTFYLEQDYVIFGASYKPLALSTVLNFSLGGQSNTMYLVEETPTQDNNGGVVRFTRVYSTIPRARVEHQQFSYTFAGLDGGLLYAPAAITANSNAGQTTVLTAAGHGLVVGDSAQVAYAVTDTTGFQYIRRTFRPIISVSGDDVTVKLITDITSKIVYIQIQKIDVGRTPQTLNVRSVLQYDYFLLGTSTNAKTYLDIPIIEPEIIIDENGQVTNTYSANTSPTVSTYKALIAAGTQIVAESSVLEIWKGNIYQRATRYVVAQ